MPLFPESQPLKSGMLPEEDGHSVFWETRGNPDGPAILLLHGGPGGGVSPRMTRLFDPAKWQIVAMDQRGAGRSQPNAGDSLAALTVRRCEFAGSDYLSSRTTSRRLGRGITFSLLGCGTTAFSVS